ncbi:type II 3-dehydroquinate dehydratase [Fastidiosibacter lacustris]|uniref:type II 3-dehydroquinate dehydratase n=1 Tax=Fastidiosibacter lacustris TaxID=2056695 RepID=UPI000E3405BA|nr:type II 3-dehydroquinate dehydratase [Fastidiosibacter lacustris]
MAKILVIHGPNLNLLGQRETDVYGTATLNSINQKLSSLTEEKKMNCICFQSNHEGEIVDQIQQAQGNVHFIIINPAAYTHTSVAIRDALLAIHIPFIEIHLSNLYKRELFRHHSYLSDIAYGVISGMGAQGYELAMIAAIDYCQHNCI